jgi:hypothetical protein
LSVAVALALGGLEIVLIVVVILVLAALAYTLITRDNRRQVEVDADREQVAERIGLREPVDFDSEFRPPREP